MPRTWVDEVDGTVAYVAALVRATFSHAEIKSFANRSNAELAQAEVAELKLVEQQLQQTLALETEWWSKPSSQLVGAAII